MVKSKRFYFNVNAVVDDATLNYNARSKCFKCQFVLFFVGLFEAFRLFASLMGVKCDIQMLRPTLVPKAAKDLTQHHNDEKDAVDIIYGWQKF